MTDDSEEYDIIPPAPRPLSPLARRIYARFQIVEQLHLFYALIPLLVSGLVILPSTFLLRNALVQTLVDSGWGYQKASGSVMSKQKQQTNTDRGRSYTLYSLRFQYIYNQTSYRGTQFVWEPDNAPLFRLGQSIQVEFSRYLPNFARIAGLARIKDNSQIALYILLFVIVSLWGLSMYWLYRGLIPRMRRKRIYRHGFPAKATIMSIGPNTDQLLAGQHPLQIQWVFSVDGQEFTGSYNINYQQNLPTEGGIKETIIVLYDPKAPQYSLPFLG